MQQKMLFIFGEFDNQLRRQKCMAGIKEHLLHGEWCARPPVGYDIIKVNGERKIVVNDNGKIIKKMFLWKANERVSNVEIQNRLKKHKIDYCLRRIREILENPFYCGKLAHKALDGDVVDGKHEKLITEELFLDVNNILAEKKLGMQTKKERPEISLKRFMKCSCCNLPMRGYIAKGYDMPYYKCNTPGCKSNRNTNDVNKQFEGLLSAHTIDKDYMPLIKEQLKVTFQEHNAGIEEKQEATKRQLTDLAIKLERLEERFILEEITSELYYKYKAKFENEVDEIAIEMKLNAIDMSKLDDYIAFGLDFCFNLNEMWASGDYTQRQEIQNAFFEQGIIYDRKKDECRSLEVNEFLVEASDLSRDLSNIVLSKNKKTTPTSVGAVRA
jgi:site-specific DNA recombinase